MNRTLVALVSLVSAAAFAETSAYFPVQGVLSDASGKPISTQVSLVLSLYAADTGGTALWTETQQVLPENGVFTVYLGQNQLLPATLFKDHSSLWLGIKVDADVEMPRVPLGSTPFTGFAQYCGTVPNHQHGFGDITGVLPSTALPAGTAVGPATCQSGQAAVGINADGSLMCGSPTASDLACSGCVSASEVSFNWAGASAPGGKATSSTDADKLGGLAPSAYEPTGAAANAVAVHESTTSHLSAAQYSGLTGGGATTLHTHAGIIDGINGALLTSTFTQSNPSADTPKTIPDGVLQGAESSIAIAATGTLEDVTVDVNITHPNIGEIKVTLTGPDGTAVVLHDHGSGGTANLVTNFDLNKQPASGSMSSYDGTAAAGTWRLKIVDDQLGVTGTATINSWKLNIKYLSDNTVALGSGTSSSVAVTGDLTQNGYPVWTSGNDGTGSGMDADTLDGVHASGFAAIDDSRFLTSGQKAELTGTGSTSLHTHYGLPELTAGPTLSADSLHTHAALQDPTQVEFNSTRDWQIDLCDQASSSGSGSKNNGACFLATAATNGSGAYDYLSLSAATSKNPKFFAKVAVYGSTAQDVLIGFSSDVTNPPFNGAKTAAHAAFIVYGQTLYASVANGTTQAKSGVITWSPSSGSPSYFYIEWNGATGRYDFYLNRTKVWTSTGSEPTSPGFPNVVVSTREPAVKLILVSRMVASADR